MLSVECPLFVCVQHGHVANFGVSVLLRQEVIAN